MDSKQVKEVLEEMTALVKQRYGEDDPDVWHEVLKAEAVLSSLQPAREPIGIAEVGDTMSASFIKFTDEGRALQPGKYDLFASPLPQSALSTDAQPVTQGLIEFKTCLMGLRLMDIDPVSDERRKSHNTAIDEVLWMLDSFIKRSQQSTVSGGFDAAAHVESLGTEFFHGDRKYAEASRKAVANAIRAAIRALHSQPLPSAEKDAEDARRYRWLRNKVCMIQTASYGCKFEVINLPVHFGDCAPDVGPVFDVAIDAAIAQKENGRTKRCPHGVSHLNVCTKCD